MTRTTDSSRPRHTSHLPGAHVAIRVTDTQTITSAATYVDQHRICDLTIPAAPAPCDAWDDALARAAVYRIGDWHRDPNDGTWRALVRHAVPLCTWCPSDGAAAIAYETVSADDLIPYTGAPSAVHACRDHLDNLNHAAQTIPTTRALLVGEVPAPRWLAVNGNTPDGRWIIDLYLRVRELEALDSDGGWNGGDTVDILRAMFGQCGLDINTPPPYSTDD